MNIRVDHIGITTRDFDIFEKFWCGVLGFVQFYSTTNGPDVMGPLFNMGYVEIRRYQLANSGILLEAHKFHDDVRTDVGGFSRVGYDHICIYTGGVGDRDIFLSQLPQDVCVKRVVNPKGWDTVFISDYEGNFIEVREDWNKA